MGGGAWTKATATSFVASNYAAYNVNGLDDFANLNVHQIYSSQKLADELNPKNVIRECRDSEEHPNTFPIILALDVTGSMGTAAQNCAAKLNDIMTELYGKVKDVEFMMMGIGDLAYDYAPIQATQFESDVRILDQTTKIYFEGGGGGNNFESYTAAWYFGINHTDLDCWKRGRKGLLITMGDEPLNPYLPTDALKRALGQINEDLLDTEDLYEAVVEKFNVYHIAITDQECSYEHYKKSIANTWKLLLGQHCIEGRSDQLPKIIGQIVDDCLKDSGSDMAIEEPVSVRSGGISW